MCTSDDRDAELCNCEERAADTFARDGTVVEVRALDDEKRPVEVEPKASHLAPQTALGNGSMQISDRLSLGTDTFGDDVVADVERDDLDRDSEPLERL